MTRPRVVRDGWLARHGWTLLMVGVVAALIGVTLGPALVTDRVLLSTDYFSRYAPFSSSPQVPAGFTPNNQCVGDTIDAVHPTRELVAQGYRDGRLAAWDPYPSGGTAAGALPSYGLVTPYGLAYLLLPAQAAPGFAKLVEMLLAVAGTALYLRRLGTRTAAGMLAGVAYATSGFVVSWTNWPQAGVAAMLPWAFWAAEVALAGRTMRSALPLAAVMAVLVFGGFPAVTGYLLYALVPYVLLRLWTTRGGDRGATGLDPATLLTAAARGVRLAAAVVLGVALTAVQLVPFAKNLSSMDLSSRAATPDQHLSFSGLATTVWPYILGGCSGSAMDGQYFGSANFIEGNAFVGVAVLGLAVWAVARPHRGQVPRGVRTFFTTLVVVCVLLVFLGGPLLALFQHLPIFSNNFSARLRVLLNLSAAVLAGFGFDALLRRRADSPGPLTGWRRARPLDRARLLVVPTVILLAVGWAAWLAVQESREALQANPLLTVHRDRLVSPVLLGLLAAVALVAAGWLRPRWLRLTGLVVLPVVVLVQGALLATSLWTITSPDIYYPRNPVASFLQANLDGDRYGSEQTSMPAGTETAYRIRSVTGHAFTAEPWRDLLEQVDDRAFASPTYSWLPGGLQEIGSPVLDRLATKYFVVSAAAPVIGTTVTAAQVDGQVVLGSDWLTGPLPPTGAGLRAVSVAPLVPTGTQEVAPFAKLQVEVLDPSGAVVASAQRRLQVGIGPPVFEVPVAGEDLAGRSGLRARVRLVDAAGTTVPVQSGVGQPGLGVVTAPAGGDGLRLVLADEAMVYQRLDSLHRIRWANRATVVPDPDQRVDLLASGRLADDEVVLAAPGREPVGMSADLQVQTDTGGRLRVRVDAQGGGYLVVADALVPGFVATVDGQQTPLVSADHALQGVWVPAGTHEVQVRYEVPGLTAGVAGTGGALLVVLAVLALPAVRCRGPRIAGGAPSDRYSARRHRDERAGPRATGRTMTSEPLPITVMPTPGNVPVNAEDGGLKPFVTVVLPCYNEVGHVEAELERISAAMDVSGYSYDLDVYDDCSTDGTRQLLAELAASRRFPRMRYIPRQRNGGSGTIRRVGSNDARGEIVVWTDADMTYPNERIPELVRMLAEDSSFDQVVGARLTEEGTYKLLRVPAKWVIRKVASRLTETQIPDLNSGLRAFRREVSLPYLRLLPPGFSCVTTLTVSFLANQHEVRYLPIGYAKRAGTSKFHFTKDAYRYILQVLRMVMYFNPLKVLMPLALWIVGLGLLKMVTDVVRFGFRVPGSTVLIILTGLQIAALALLADLVVRSRDDTTGR